jgi:hypothetical protein
MLSFRSIFAFMFPKRKKNQVFINACSFDPNQRREGEVVVLYSRNEGEGIFDRVTEALRIASQVIVVDQGSTDSTAYFASEAGAIVVLQKVGEPRHVGLREAMNIAIRSSRGSNIAD